MLAANFNRMPGDRFADPILYRRFIMHGTAWQEMDCLGGGFRHCELRNGALPAFSRLPGIVMKGLQLLE